MGIENPGGAGRHVPAVTLLVVAGGIVTYVVPGLASHLVYDRAAILAGEGWRLLTGSWVHFSPTHLLYDLLALGIAGWIIERRGYRHFALLCVLAALGIGILLVATRPEAQFCGGLSGVATGAIVYLALHGLREPAPWKWVCAGVLILTIGKVLVESLAGRFLIEATGSVPFVPLPLSHVVGGASAAVLFWWSRAREARPERTAEPP